MAKRKNAPPRSRRAFWYESRWLSRWNAWVARFPGQRFRLDAQGKPRPVR
jgi:hypothetical protein